MNRVCVGCILASVIIARPLISWAADGGMPTQVDETRALTVEGIATRSGDDDPRVLYILPWQSPTLPRRPPIDLNAEAPGLLAPVDPVTLERHRHFRETLDPDLDAAVTRY